MMCIIIQEASANSFVWPFLALVVSLVCALVQWRIQFITKARHEAATKFLEKLSFLEGVVNDYRRPAFNKAKYSDNIWEKVCRAYIDTNRALTILKVVIPGKDTKKIADVYKDLIEDRIIRKIYGIHTSYVSKNEKTIPPEYAEIIYAIAVSNIQRCQKKYEVLQQKSPELVEDFSIGVIYLHENKYSFKDHIYKELFEGNLTGKTISDDKIVKEATNDYDIFGKIIQKYFSEVIEQCQENFFISSKILLPMYEKLKKFSFALRMKA